MPDYSKGKIYTIRCRTNPQHVYVGGTVKTLSRRLQCHKSRSINYQNMLLYSTIANNWDNWFIQLYEDFPCDNRKQLCKREGEIIRLIGTLNTKIAGRSLIEYRLENVDFVKDYNKNYYKNNADKIKEMQKNYQQKNAEKLKLKRKEYLLQNADKLKQQRKEYRQRNADKIKLQKQDYHRRNADKIKQKKQELIQPNADKIKQQKQELIQQNAHEIEPKKQELIQQNNALKYTQHFVDFQLNDITFSYSFFMISK